MYSKLECTYMHTCQAGTLQFYRVTVYVCRVHLEQNLRFPYTFVPDFCRHNIDDCPAAVSETAKIFPVLRTACGRFRIFEADSSPGAVSTVPALPAVPQTGPCPVPPPLSLPTDGPTIPPSGGPELRAGSFKEPPGACGTSTYAE